METNDKMPFDFGESPKDKSKYNKGNWCRWRL